MRLVQIPRSGLKTLDLSSLRQQVVYATHPTHWSLASAVEEGITILEAPADGVPDGAILLIPPPAGEIDHLVAVVDRLLGPGGCPWDQAQTHDTLKRHLLEEAYEVVEAIESGNPDSLREELGDLLLQPVMHGQISHAAGGFDTEAVAKSIVEKLIRRHPHVFGGVGVSGADEVLRNWDQIKRAEKGDELQSVLAGVPRVMPSLHRAFEVSKRAARTGFEWPDLPGVFEKLDEELDEVRAAITANDPKSIEAEIGDLLFTIVNIARWCKVEPEEALRKMVDRFTARFQYIEANAPGPLSELSADDWDLLWSAAKAAQEVA